MTELREQDAEALPETVAEAGSLMGRLREKRQLLAAQTTTDIPLAGYGGELVARYRLLDPLVEGKEIGTRVTKQFANQPDEQNYYALVDTLIAACEGLYVKAEAGLVALDPDGNGPVSFEDGRLADFLDFQAASARDAVLAVFAGNRIAVAMHAVQLQWWMGDTSGELDTGLFSR